MNEKTWSDKTLKIAKITFLIIYIITIIFGCFFKDQPKHTFPDEKVSFDTEWVVVNEDGKLIEAKTPIPIKTKRTTLIAKLPNVDANDILAFEIKYSYIKAMVNGNVIYESSAAKFGPLETTVGNYIVMIKLDPSYSNKEITIEIDRRDAMYSASIKDIYLTTRDAFVLDKITSNVLSLVIIIIFGLIFIVSIILYFVMKIKKYDFAKDLENTFLYLGLFSLCMGFWITGSLNIIGLLTNNLVFTGLMNFISFMILPITVFELVRSLIKGDYKFVKIIEIISIAVISFNFIAFLTGLVDLSKTLIFAQIVDGTLLISLFIIVYLAIKNKQIKNSTFIITSLSIIGVLCAASLILYALDFNWKNIMYIACFVAIITLFVVCAIRLVRAPKDIVKNKEYYYYAYNDELTGLLNRKSYNKKLELLENTDNIKSDVQIQKNDIYFVALDVNNLKNANDTYGHLVGDRLIKEAATIIKDVFSDYGTCYRVGGDEFMVIIEKEIPSIEELLDVLYQNTNEVNIDDKLGLSIAYGYSKMSLDNRKDINEYIKEADMSMYLNKKEYYSHKEFDRRRN